MEQKNNILITGATGLVGRELVSLFSENFPDSNIIATYNSRKPFVTKNSVSWEKLNLTNIKNKRLKKIVFDIVIHAAAFLPPGGSNPEDFSRAIFDVNVIGTIKLFDFINLKKNTHIIYISSATVYSESDRNFRENNKIYPPHIGGVYGYSKIYCEWYLRKRFKQLAIVRPTYIYGRGMDRKKLLPRLLIQCMRNETLSIKPPFNIECDYIHSRDVASGIYKIAGKRMKGAYNLGSGYGVDIQKLAERCIEATGGGKFPYVQTKPSANISRQLLVDITKAKSLLSWAPEVKLIGGLRDLMFWLRQT